MRADPAFLRHAPGLSRAAPPGAGIGRRLGAAARSGAVLAVLWALLRPGDPSSWIVGVPCILGGAALSAALAPARPARISARGVLRFGLFCAVGTVRGAVDVALRAVRPDPRLDPGFVEIALDLPAGTPRILFANTVSLLPGTLTADLRGDRAILHVIDRGVDPGPELDRLRSLVRGVFAGEGGR